MPPRELFLLCFTSPGNPVALPEGFLRERKGMLIRSAGDGLFCAFETGERALEAALALRERIPHGRGGLTRGSSPPSPEEPSSLSSRAAPGQIMASEAFVQSLPDGRRFHRVEPGFFAYEMGGDGKELFDFSRAEQERALEARMVTRPEHRVVETDAPIPFAVQPPESAGSRPEIRRPPLPIRRERPPAWSGALWALLIFVVIVPALLIGLWWGWGTAQRREAPTANDDEIRQKLERSEALQALQAKRPEGASASEIAQGTYATYGALVVESSPAGASVFLDGRRIEGKTPVRIAKVESRTPLHLRIRKEGYEDSEQLLTLSPEEEKTVSAELRKIR